MANPNEIHTSELLESKPLYAGLDSRRLGQSAVSRLALAPAPTYIDDLHVDMSDERVEKLINEVTSIVLGRLRQREAEARQDGGLDRVIDGLMESTTWSRSALQLPVRRAAAEMNLSVDLIRSRLVDAA